MADASAAPHARPPPQLWAFPSLEQQRVFDASEMRPHEARSAGNAGARAFETQTLTLASSPGVLAARPRLRARVDGVRLPGRPGTRGHGVRGGCAGRHRSRKRGGARAPGGHPKG